MKYVFYLSSLALLFSCSSHKSKKVVPNYTVEQFYQSTAIGGGYFSEDENKLVYTSDESGIFNVYEIEIATGEKKALTQSTQESYYSRGYVPGTNNILYTADKGGNEITHIYLQKEDSTTLDLTPGANEKASFFGWSKDKTHLYFQSNKRDQHFFDFYKMKIGEWKAEIMYENVQNFNVSSISNNERYFMLSKTITTSQNDFYLFDRKTQNLKKLSDIPGSYGSAGFSDDNKELFYITDAEKEFAYLIGYTIATGEKRIIYETNWDVSYSYLSENETYRIIALNEDGKNTLIILNNETEEKVAFPKIADGDILAVSMSRSESKIRLSIGSSKTPNNLYVYNFEKGELIQLTKSQNPALETENLVSAEVIRYPSFDGLEIPAIYYKPLQANKENKVPALVWVHGGPGGQSRVSYFPLIQYLVNQGYAILAVNNRGSSGYGKTFYTLDDQNHGDKDLKDCIWGKKWLEQQDYIDSSKIGIIGGSYGGYMTMAALTFAPDEFEVGVNIFGVTNWIRTLKSIPPFWEASRNALYKELGDPFSADSIRLKAISPLFHAHQVKKPLMVLQGANDPRVLQVESDEIVAAVKQNNVPVEYIIFPDEGHGFRKKENQVKGYGKIKNFLDNYLKGFESENPTENLD